MIYMIWLKIRVRLFVEDIHSPRNDMAAPVRRELIIETQLIAVLYIGPNFSLSWRWSGHRRIINEMARYYAVSKMPLRQNITLVARWCTISTTSWWEKAITSIIFALCGDNAIKEVRLAISMIIYTIQVRGQFVKQWPKKFALECRWRKGFLSTSHAATFRAK